MAEHQPAALRSLLDLLPKDDRDVLDAEQRVRNVLARYAVRDVVP